MKRQLTLEHALYALAILLALFLRLYRLGAAPLADMEAGWALQALELARGGQPVLGPQPAYVLLTSLLFGLLDNTNFLARLIPALAGCLLVALPLFSLRLLGESLWLRRAGLVMAFGLALDPGLVALSRQTGSYIPALAFGLLALAFCIQRRMVFAGIFTALALLSGPALLPGILGLVFAWGLFRLLEKWLGWRLGKEEQPQAPIPAASWRSGLLALGGTLLIAGMLFLQAPQGLGALTATLPAYLNGWLTPSGVPALRLPAALLVYQPLVLIFALLAVIRTGWSASKGLREGLAVWLSLWALAALLLAMLYPARQVSDLVWALVPLWALASLELARHFPTQELLTTRWVACGLAALLVILQVIAWLNLHSLARFQTNMTLYLAIILGALLMGVVATLLVAAGWSLDAARLGVVWGVSLALGLGMLAVGWGGSQLRPNGAQELWSVPPASGQTGELLATLTDLSTWETGFRDQLDLVVTADTPSMRWALRDFDRARFVSSLAASDSPPVVITLKDQQTPTLAQIYRGQDLIWQQYPGWQEVLPPDLAAWLAFRQAPLVQQQIVLWARIDLFPGGGLDAWESLQPSSPLEPDEQFVP